MVRQLLFRCAQCRVTTSTQVEIRLGAVAEVVCASCGSTYALDSERHRSVSDEEYVARVRSYARSENIDVASACSVFEGIMQRGNVRTLRTSAEASPAVVTRSTAFRSIFLVGLLFVFSAFFAGRAVGGRAVATGPGLPVAPAIRSAGPALPASLPAGRSSWIVCQLNEAQSLTKLSGPDPRTVFDALLDQPGYGGNLVPYGLASASGGGYDSKIAVARDRMDTSQMYSVRIWGDRQGRWIVGDGRAPVHLEPIDAEPESFEAF